MPKTKKAPFRIVKRTDIKPLKKLLFYVAAIFIALALGALLLLSLGVNPFKLYKDMFTIGMIGNAFPYKSIEGYIKVFVPLLITSLALSLAFKMKFWNIGGEGQFMIGATTASAVALIFGDSLPSFLLLLFMTVSAAVTSGLYGFVVAVLKVKFNTNETLMTLMFNYIALYLLKFFGETQGEWNIFLSEASVRPVFKAFPKSAVMPSISIGKFSLNISLIFAVVIALLIFLYLKKTKHGYEISVVGDSINTAKYAGMNVSLIILRTTFLSAALIGMAGAFYISTAGVLSTSCTNNVGWTGIIVAWLSNLNTVAITLTSALIGILQYGCQVASSEFTTIDSNFADLLQGIILFFALAANFFIKYKIVSGKKTKEAE